MTDIWAHRGASVALPENTLAAFAAAVAAGADGVEFDVQLSADGVPVVIHDERVDRTHDGVGWVGELSASSLASLAPRAAVGAAGAIPTLDEVLDLLAPTSLAINIELKNSVVSYPGLEQRVVAAVAARGLVGRTVLSTFNHHSLRLLAGLGSGCELAAIYSDPLYKPWDYLASLGVQAVHPPVAALDDGEFVARCHERGLAVRPWFSNDADELAGLMAAGVDALFTDDPALALAVRADRRSTR